MEQARRLGPDLLRVPMRAEGPEGVIGDGMADIGPDNPQYAAWDKWLTANPPEDGEQAGTVAAAVDVQLELPLAAAEATRDLSDDEQASGVDFEQIQADHDAAVAALVAVLPALLGPIAASLVAATIAALAGGALAGLADLTADVVEVAAFGDRVGARAVTLARLSARRAAREVKGIGLRVGPVDVDEADLLDRGLGTARLVAQGMAQTASRVALANAGQDPERVAAAVRAALDEVVKGDRTWVAGPLAAAMSAAQHAGRLAVFEQVVEAHGGSVTFVASEINDKSTCAVCSEADGKRFESLTAALAVYPAGQNVGCLGRDRCRGTLFAVRR